MQFCSIPATLIIAGALFTLTPAGVLTAQTSIPVSNFSFESPTQNDGSTSVGLSNWLVVGNTTLPIIGTPLTETILTSNPTNAQYPGTSGAGSVGTMDGSQIASFRTSLLTLAGSATQGILPNLLSLNTQYTLTVAVGNPLDSVFQGYTVALTAGGTTLASVTNSGVDVADGTFRDVSLTYTLGNVSPVINTGFLISLSVPGVPVGSLLTDYGTDFDNVRLTATPVAIPEPGTTASIVFGLLGLVGVQYVRRHRGVSLRA